LKSKFLTPSKIINSNFEMNIHWQTKEVENDGFKTTMFLLFAKNLKNQV
jgi:hypothetical protein